MNKENSNGQGLLSKDNAKAVFRYAVKPDILPRIRALGLHFGHFAYLIALVLNSARLIPQGHPTLQAANIGKFGVRQILAIAANNIKWSLKNIDQIVIFGAVVSGLIMIAVQAVIIVLYAFVGSASATSSPSEGFFTTPEANVSTDAALIMLEQVFGPDLNFFGAASEPLGTPVYAGLHAVLGFYSMATMVIAVIIVVYYIMTVVGEAAKTGTPFGQRFNTLWAPIRLVVALGMLVPMASGLNTAQYLTLWTAKLGSGLGTQVWMTFVNEFTSTSNIISKPENKSTIALVQRVFLNEVCAASYNQIEETSSHSIKILQKIGGSSQTPNFSNIPDMIALAGIAGESAVDLSWSAVNPGEDADDYTCGHISVSLSEFDLYEGGELVGEDELTGAGFWNWVFGGAELVDKIGAINGDIKAAYLKEIKTISDAVKPAAIAIAKVKISVNAKPESGNISTLAFIPDLLRTTAEQASEHVNHQITLSFNSMAGSEYTASGASSEMTKRGWAAAGLWYGNIGKINHKFDEAISSAAPTLGKLFSADDVTADNRWFRWGDRYDVSGGSAEMEAAIFFANDNYGENIASGVPANSPLYQDARDQAASKNAESTFGYILTWIFGAKDMYDMKNNPDLDPMSRLVSGGHTMVTRSLVVFGVGSVTTVVGALLKLTGDKGKSIGEVVQSISSLLFAFAAVGFAAGVFLAYILPIIPFIYFSFAVIGWVLEIFEAIVAMPLWALAHLRIDGDGMPGQAAIQGYHLLLMILLRPALIIMGLIGGYIIFGAAMYFFTSMFNSAVSITRADFIGDATGGVGVFVYTVIYTFLAYNIALMCFKMIDDVPKGIMRWMGSSAQPFSDSRGDPIEGSRGVIVAAVAGGTALSNGVSSTSRNLQEAKKNRKLRAAGVDEDTGLKKGG